MWEVTSKYELVRGGTFYDLIAFLCWAIHGLPRAVQTKLYKDFTSRYQEICSARDIKYPFLSAKNVATPICPDGLSEDMIFQLQPLFSTEESADWLMILAVAVAVDELVEFFPNRRKLTLPQHCWDVSKPDLFSGHPSSAGVSESFYSLPPLNGKTYADFGEVFPRIPHAWKKGGSRNLESVQFSPLSFLCNYIWIPPGSKWTGEHLLLLPRRDSNQSSLRIFLSSLSCHAPFQVDTVPASPGAPGRCSEFHIRYLDKPAAQITARIKQIIDKAIKEQADIVVLPEVMGSPTCIQESAAYLQKMARGGYPLLFLLPTVEYQTNGGWVNQLIGLDAEGYGIFGYNKQHAFQVDSEEGQSFFEPIQPDGRFYVVHIPNVGRVGFIICSDVFEDGYVEHMVKQYKLTVLFHIAFSFGRDLLQRGVSVTNEQMCDVVICNTCAAWDDTKLPEEERPSVEVPDNATVASYVPNGHEKATSIKTFSGCGKTDKCQGCMLSIEIPTGYKDEIPPISPIYF